MVQKYNECHVPSPFPRLLITPFPLAGALVDKGTLQVFFKNVLFVAIGVMVGVLNVLLCAMRKGWEGWNQVDKGYVCPSLHCVSSPLFYIALHPREGGRDATT